MIEIYTDGACSVQKRIGGLGIVMIHGEHRKEMSFAYQDTTNNRMELTSVIIALEHLKKPNLDATIYSDSKYVIDSVQKGWLYNWERDNFKDRLNSDLWIRFLLIFRQHNVSFVWVKGHASNKENNRCDELAVSAYKSGNFVN